MYAEQQKQAMDQYLQDKRYHVTMESNSRTIAILSGRIDTTTGNVDHNTSVHWQYFGKQAVRTAYYACRKQKQTLYTW